MLLRIFLLSIGIALSFFSAACTDEPDYDMEVILSLELDKYLISEELIGYQNSKGEILYPLVDLMQALEVGVYAENGMVKGSIFDKKNKIFINPKTQQATFQEVDLMGKAYQQLIEDQQLACYENTVYVSESVLERLLPADFDYESSQLRTKISPQRLFPVQIQQKKDALKKREGWVGKFQDQAVVQQYTDERFSWNIASLAVQLNSDFMSSNVNLETGGRFLYHDVGVIASTTLAGNKAKLNLFGSRRILNPDFQPYVSHYKFGDMSISSVLGVSNNHVGIGAGITNQPFNFLAERNMDFSGTVAPQWFVEMFINGVLMGFSEPDENNRFLFENINLFPGKNTVKYIFYGPQGQIETSESEYFLDDLSYNKHKLFYNIEFLKAGSDLLQTVMKQDEKEDDDNRYSILHSSFSLGLTDSVAFKLSTWHKQDAQTEISTSDLTSILRPGIKARFSDFVQFEYYRPFYLDHIRQAANQFKLNLYPIKYLNLWLDADYYENGYTNLEATESFDYRYKAGARYFIPAIRTRITGEFESSKAVNRESPSYNARLSLNSAYEQFNSALDVERRQNSDEATYRGTASFSYAHKNLTQQASISGLAQRDYKGLDKFSYANRFLFSGKWLNLFKARYSIRDKSYGFSNSIFYNNTYFSLGLQLGFEQNKGWSGGLSFNTSIVKDSGNQFDFFNRATPDSSLASVGIKVIKADGTESYIKKGAVKVDGRFVDLNTSESSLANENGTIIAGIEPYKWVTVEVEESALEDASWAVKTKPVEVMIEPGGMERIVFTVVETGEIDGIVATGGNKLIPKKGIKVLLFNPKGELVKEAITAFDGFYLFDKVEPGQYLVKIDPHYLKRNKLTAYQKTIALKDEAMFSLNNDFLLLPATKDEAIASKAEKALTRNNISDGMRWVFNQNSESFTLQLMAIAKEREAALMKVLKQHTQLKDSLHYFEATKNGQDRVVVVYGNFSSIEEAQQAGKKLPKAFNKPWLRKIKNLKNEISRTHKNQLLTSKSANNHEREAVKIQADFMPKTAKSLKRTSNNTDAKTKPLVKSKVTPINSEKTYSQTRHSDGVTWAMSQRPENYTLQLMAVNKARKPELLKLLKKQSQLNDALHHVKKSNNGQDQYVLIYGSFSTAAEAKEAGKTLPKTFSKPWLRLFKGLQNEIKVETEALVLPKTVKVKKTLDVPSVALVPKAETNPKIHQKTETLADKQWVLNQSPGNFTLQLMAVSIQRKAALLALFKKHKDLQDNLHYYAINQKGKERYVLIFGNFPDAASANQAVNKLPKTFSQPWLRKFDTVQKELKLNS